MQLDQYSFVLTEIEDYNNKLGMNLNLEEIRLSQNLKYDCIYSKMDPLFGASIGQHYRHSLQHFSKLIDSDIDVINYDQRERGTEIEKSMTHANNEIKRI